MNRIYIFLFVFLLSIQLKAQNESLNDIDLLSDINSVNGNDSVELLPKNILFTQKILWGKNGVIRNFDYFELTPEKRQRELNIRRYSLVAHQVLGFATLGAMVGQGFVGAKLYNGNMDTKTLHEILAGAINFGYFTTAGLALFIPPKMIDERKGYSSIKVHKALAVVHLTSMIATNILASQLGSHPELKSYHRAAAFTALGSFAAAMIIIKF